ncbi:MOS1T transposase, partial [Pseudoatta argentina]
MSIQSPAKCEIRSVIRYLIWKGKTPVEVYNEVKTAYGDKGMNRTSVFKWCREFKNGRTSVHDDQRSGRSSILTDDIVEKIENALRDDRRSTVDELSAMFPQISRSLLHETITETLGYRKLSARWVPKQLTDQHKLNRVEAGREFLRRYKLHGDEFLRSIVTGDETWVEKIDESTVSKRLKGLGMIQKQGHWVPYELKPRTTASTAEKKRFFASHRIVYTTIIQSVENRGVSPAMHPHRPQNQISMLLYAQRHDKVILLHDNARPHVAKPVKTYLETLKWEVLPHPPYSPDIAPSDFHLFRSMAHGLADRRFHSYEEAEKWIDSWIASKDMSFFRRGIHVLPERWEKEVSSDGQYFK